MGKQTGDPRREPVCKVKGRQAGKASVALAVQWQSGGEFSLTEGLVDGSLFSFQAFN